MTETKDPMEIYRQAMASAPVVIETSPPRLERAEVWPYPDLARLWVRVQIGPFAASPNLALRLYDSDQQMVSTMFMVEVREPYQSLTIHLRQTPRPGEAYRMELELSRDEEVLDAQAIDFLLAFHDPGTAHGGTGDPPAR